MFTQHVLLHSEDFVRYKVNMRELTSGNLQASIADVNNVNGIKTVV